MKMPKVLLALMAVMAIALIAATNAQASSTFDQKVTIGVPVTGQTTTPADIHAALPAAGGGSSITQGLYAKQTDDGSRKLLTTTAGIPASEGAYALEQVAGVHQAPLSVADSSMSDRAHILPTLVGHTCEIATNTDHTPSCGERASPHILPTVVGFDTMLSGFTDDVPGHATD